MSQLQVARKTVEGVTIGYVVGWRTRWKHYWGVQSGGVTFRSVREGLIFKTQKKAEEFRDKIEEKRVQETKEFEILS